ncbi:MAG: endonuclease/exonuclease/phosphatase family protein, partial [Bacteroidota bacterium]
PDIILLQEVDLNAKKSGYINQLQYLLDHTYFNYGVFAYTWKSPFVPSDGLGRIHEGNAILSRWKIKDAQRIKLPRREDQDALTHYFYIQPCILKAEITLPQIGDFIAYDLHLSAFATDDSKKRQIDVLMKELNKSNSDGKSFVIGGDFNLLPPNSDSTDFCIEDMCSGESFHQSGDDPFHKDGSNHTHEITWMQPLYDSYTPAVSLSDYGNSQSEYFTHTTRVNTDWDRKLDYLFTNMNWKTGSEITHKDVINISDHAAVSSVIEVP